jgi:hypothetical protein
MSAPGARDPYGLSPADGSRDRPGDEAAKRRTPLCYPGLKSRATQDTHGLAARVLIVVTTAASPSGGILLIS